MCRTGVGGAKGSRFDSDAAVDAVDPRPTRIFSVLLPASLTRNTAAPSGARHSDTRRRGRPFLACRDARADTSIGSSATVSITNDVHTSITPRDVIGT